MSAMRVDGGLTDLFETIVGVLQGCILYPLLFNILLEVVMALALEDEELGARTAGIRISNLRFADDISLLAEGEGGLPAASGGQNKSDQHPVWTYSKQTKD